MQEQLRDIYAYCDQMSTDEPEYLRRIYRNTHLKTAWPQMLVGPIQGKFLAWISQMQQPQRILEIGTFTGYSALYLAQGLTEDGRLDTIEINPEWEPLIRTHWSWAPSTLRQKLHLHIGDALQLLPQLSLLYDLIFVDANKQDYPALYEESLRLLRPGGLLLCDNTLWSGKVLHPVGDPDAIVLHRFNQTVKNDPRVEVLLLPLRDGLSIIRKKSHSHV